MIKDAKTTYPITDLISERWSPRAFSKREMSLEEMYTILEAASWAPSANNEQPWSFKFALRETPGFDAMVSCLMPGNQGWAKNAAALVLTIGKKNYLKTGQPNRYYMHDAGMANANLITQALSMEIYAHLMGGFDAQKTIEKLELENNEDPICFIALGYLGSPEQLDEPFKSRELATRNRKPLEEIASDASYSV